MSTSDWQPAFSAVAESSATLSGLLFVSLSFKLNAASSDSSERLLLIAKRSFYDFLATLVLSLSFLAPSVSVKNIGAIIVVLGLTRIVWHVGHWRMYFKFAKARVNLWEYLFPTITTVMIFVAGVKMLVADEFGPKLVYAAAIALMLGACQNAWRLLVG